MEALESGPMTSSTCDPLLSAALSSRSPAIPSTHATDDYHHHSHMSGTAETSTCYHLLNGSGRLSPSTQVSTACGVSNAVASVTASVFNQYTTLQPLQPLPPISTVTNSSSSSSSDKFGGTRSTSPQSVSETRCTNDTATTPNALFFQHHQQQQQQAHSPQHSANTSPVALTFQTFAYNVNIKYEYDMKSEQDSSDEQLQPQQATVPPSSSSSSPVQQSPPSQQQHSNVSDLSVVVNGDNATNVASSEIVPHPHRTAAAAATTMTTTANAVSTEYATVAVTLPQQLQQQLAEPFSPSQSPYVPPSYSSIIELRCSSAKDDDKLCFGSTANSFDTFATATDLLEASSIDNNNDTVSTLDHFLKLFHEFNVSSPLRERSAPPSGGSPDSGGSDMDELNTKDLAQRISAELKRYSIPQAIFAQRVLCRSQGTLSDLLRNPKPWSKLKSGRETFRRMAKWLQEPEFQRMSALRLAGSLKLDLRLMEACPSINLDPGTEACIGLIPALEGMDKWMDMIIFLTERTLHYHSACKRKEEQQVNGSVQPSAPKKPRLVFTDIQRRTLQAIFKETKRPSREMQLTISQQLQLDPTTVANFFMNARRRGHDRTRQEEEQQQQQTHSLLNNNDQQQHEVNSQIHSSAQPVVFEQL
ncbi:unnamed protein product [Anisakis simplex]|uniref:One cut domain family member n=1 Tax=Anisakis simplex TaxID=6269 RepID=A0A0M3JX25_ANISI|nr:unnamed protein product [Anisakis simplex]